MASPPFNIAETVPADDDFASQFPTAERAFRDVVESWLLIDHNVQGRHDAVSLDDQNADLTIAADVVGVWNKDGALRTRNGVGAVTNIPMDSSLLATLASPVFTGNPTAPTPSLGDDSTSIATTAYVTDSIAAELVNLITGGFKNLVIQNNSGTPNTSIDVDADAVTVETSGGVSYRLQPINLTIDCTTTGANALDAGGLANSTWYSVWVIYNPTTDTTAGLASTSETTPTLPSGYTAKARFGWMRTDGSAVFMRVLQKGRRATYIVGTNPAVSRNIVNGTQGTYSTTSPTLVTADVSGFVPSTASAIHLSAHTLWKNGTLANLLVAPNTSYGGTNNGPRGSAGQVYPINSDSISVSISDWMQLEGTTIAVAINGAGGAVNCNGWEDNL